MSYNQIVYLNNVHNAYNMYNANMYKMTIDTAEHFQLC